MQKPSVPWYLLRTASIERPQPNCNFHFVRHVVIHEMQSARRETPIYVRKIISNYQLQHNVRTQLLTAIKVNIDFRVWIRNEHPGSGGE